MSVIRIILFSPFLTCCILNAEIPKGFAQSCSVCATVKVECSCAGHIIAMDSLDNCEVVVSLTNCGANAIEVPRFLDPSYEFETVHQLFFRLEKHYPNSDRLYMNYDRKGVGDGDRLFTDIEKIELPKGRTHVYNVWPFKYYQINDSGSYEVHACFSWVLDNGGEVVFRSARGIDLHVGK